MAASPIFQLRRQTPVSETLICLIFRAQRAILCID